jgi:type II secretory pathway component GspD/PulD (secretin)
MKPTRLSLFALAAVTTIGQLPAQSPDSDSVYRALVEKREAARTPTPESEALVEPVVPAPAKKTTVEVAQANAPAETSSNEVVAEDKKPVIDSEEGYLIKEANLNDIFQFLAKEANRQYFHNSKINTPEYRVTGHLNSGNPLQQMEELAFMYGLTLYTKGSTVYALTQAQLGQLPGAEFQYQLKYLRPTDIAQIKELIKPVLSPTGVVNFEPKTNTVVIVDNAQKIEAARSLLHDVDQAKGQIVVETKILRINSAAADRVGVNWSSSLGENGVPLSVARSLNSVFGIDSMFGEVEGTGDDAQLLSNAVGSTTGSTLTTKEIADPASNIVLSPLQLNGVLRALAEGGLAKQVSNPTLITEDNEQATISIIDRVPIITTTASQGASTTLSSEEVRYKIDESDSTIDKEPEKHREIGISLVVTPTLLPDGTVRMRMRPRSAQITDEIKSATSGNVYPRVTESMIETLARVPDGYSLLVGGFYGEVQKNNKTKVPLLGDVPVLNFFFKSKELTKENTSLVFIVTPKSYDPRDRCQTRDRNLAIRDKISLPADHDWVDPTNAGPAHEPNMRRTIRGIKPNPAPYYPQTDKPLIEELPIDENCDSAKAVIIQESRPNFSRARK